ncbi:MULTISPECIES: hypothetical protein [unclassified Nocardioides]|uniref:hypothetical protein n=1 Tax=unclassified Nocardioides TaxID=2615069 RepID=UPI000B1ED662|nr:MULTISPECIES: hypothetical protein [unclassified Nocardioides]
MPNAGRISLSAADLAMPTVDDLSNKGFQNVLLDRALGGGPVLRTNSAAAAKRLTREHVSLFVNLTRLVDKALREYEASRAALINYLSPPDEQLRTTGYVVAVDHLENCISAASRSAVIIRALRERGYGRAAPRLTPTQEERLAFIRNAIEHSDERILGTFKSKKIRKFDSHEPIALRLANRHAVIGDESIRYIELSQDLRKFHRAIEVMRGVQTGAPGPNWPNMKLHTDFGVRPGGTAVMASDYLRELSRLIVTH